MSFKLLVSEWYAEQMTARQRVRLTLSIPVKLHLPGWIHEHWEDGWHEPVRQMPCRCPVLWDSGAGGRRFTHRIGRRPHAVYVGQEATKTSR